MFTKVYVGKLSYNTTEEALRELFSQAGPVKTANIIIDKFTGRSKGFGFVEFESADDAQKAVEQFDGYDFEGFNLKVTEALPPKPRDSYGSGGSSYGGSNNRSGGYSSGGGSNRGGGNSRGGNDSW